METFTDIINAWEKPAHLAEDIGEEVGTVRQWRNRDTFPDRVWKAAVEAAMRRGIEGVTLDLLATIAARASLAAPAPTAAASDSVLAEESPEAPPIGTAPSVRAVVASLAGIDEVAVRQAADAATRHEGGRGLPRHPRGMGPSHER